MFGGRNQGISLKHVNLKKLTSHLNGDVEQTINSLELQKRFGLRMYISKELEY